MPTAQQRLDESLSRVYRSNDWLWWTLASFVNDQEKVYRAKHGEHSLNGVECRTNMEGWLVRIDQLNADEAFVEALVKDEECYREHSREVGESTKDFLNNLRAQYSWL